MRKVFEAYGPMAASQGAVAVTGDGLRLRPGRHDRRAHRAGLGPLDEIVLAYCTRGFGASRGTPWHGAAG